MATGAERRSAREVVLQNPNRYRGIETGRLRPWLESLLEELAEEATTLTIRFVGDRAMRELNARYRRVDRTTDVLSFPGGPTPEGLHLGDIAIAVPVARRQAAAQGHSIDRELRCLLLHGVLHCLGHDHESDGGEMERFELELRARWVDGEEA